MAFQSAIPINRLSHHSALVGVSRDKHRAPRVTAVIHAPRPNQAPSETVPKIPRTAEPKQPNQAQEKSPLKPGSDFAKCYVSVKETPKPVELQVQGQIPPYLQGNLYRIGPGVFDLKHADGLPAERRHWLDGIGMVYKFSLDPDQSSISFMSRVCSPDVVRAIKATPKESYKEVTFGGRDDRASPLSKFRHWMRPLTNDPVSGVPPANMNVSLEGIPGRGKLVTRTDRSMGGTIDPETLAPLSLFEFSDIHPALGGYVSAAHSAHDPATGESFNFVTGHWSDLRRYRVFGIDRDGAAEVLADIRGTPASHVHSVALTTNYVVFCITPWRVNVMGLLTSFQMEPNLSFNNERRSRFYVVSRKEKRLVGEFDCPAMTSFHYVNAFEEADGSAVHVDLSRHQQAGTLGAFYLYKIRAGVTPNLSPVEIVRFSLNGLDASTGADDAVKGVAEERDLGAPRLEFPCVSPTIYGRPYRFAYGISHVAAQGDDDDNILANTFVKVDWETGERKIWQEARCSVGEMTFVPDPNDDAEDGGSLVSVVVDARRNTSFILVLDARTMQETCRAYTPEIVPQALHGMYIARQELL